MNLFDKYKSVHDEVYGQLLVAREQAKIDYWCRHYNRLWTLCFSARPAI